MFCSRFGLVAPAHPFTYLLNLVLRTQCFRTRDLEKLLFFQNPEPKSRVIIYFYPHLPQLLLLIPLLARRRHVSFSPVVGREAGRDLLELSVAQGTSSAVVFALASSPAAAKEEPSPSRRAAGGCGRRQQLPSWLAEMPTTGFQLLQFAL